MPAKKRRDAGSGTIRQRADGRWEGRYTVGYDPETGKQIMRSVYAKTKREVREKLNKTLTDIQEGTYIEPTSITVGEWLDTWLKEYKINLRLETKASYEMHIRIHLKPDLGKIRLNKLTTHQIQHLYNKLINERGLSPKTVKNVHGALHAALEQAKINASNAIVFIYPVFWSEAPAKLVGWFDRVWSYGFAYGEKTMKTLEKGLILCSAGNPVGRLEQFGILDSMKKVMLGDRLFGRVKQAEFVVFDNTSRENELREKNRDRNLETAYEKGRTLFILP